MERQPNGDRFTLLSDGGNIVAFTMGADWRPHGVQFQNLPQGPGTGWEKRDRDTESMAADPATGQIWVGYERYNAIWRYAPGFARAEAQGTPPEMARWPINGGPESLARLPDGRFVTISEDAHVPPAHWTGAEAERLHSRTALLFPGDPIRTRPIYFAYMPYGRYDPQMRPPCPTATCWCSIGRSGCPFGSAIACRWCRRRRSARAAWRAGSCSRRSIRR